MFNHTSQPLLSNVFGHQRENVSNTSNGMLQYRNERESSNSAQMRLSGYLQNNVQQVNSHGQTSQNSQIQQHQQLQQQQQQHRQQYNQQPHQSQQLVNQNQPQQILRNNYTQSTTHNSRLIHGS